MFAPHRYRNATSQVSDPNFENVSLLLHGDGTNGAQNNTFLDSSTNNFTITRNGTPTQGSFSPYGNSWSNYFNGTTDYLTAPSNTAFSFGTGNFTVEYWIYYPSFSNTNGKPIIDSRPLQTNGNYWVAGLNATGIPAFTTMTSGGVTLLAPQSYPNQWIHVAATRNSGTLRLFINGTQVAISSGNVDNISSSGLAIGTNAYRGTAPDTYFGGFISNIRIVNGTALYTSNFTPPTSNLTAVAGTSLLTCQSNRFIDNSSNNFTITANGTPTVQPNSPFNPTSEYSITANGGSAYFNGDSDYLTIPDSPQFNLAANNFTIESWVYVKLVSEAYYFGKYSGNISTSSFYYSIYDERHAFTVILNGGDYTASSIDSISLNEWTHLAAVRNGNIITLYVNGILNDTIAIPSGSAINNSTIPLGIGGAGGLNDQPINGYISSARIVNGTAIYTSNFTPPTSPLTAVANTSLLCNFTNAGIFDNAAKNNLLTVGDARVSTAQKKYGSGSMYFDGSEDYFTVPTSNDFAFGTGDFTLEAWVNPTARITSFPCIYSNYSAYSTGSIGLFAGHNTYSTRYSVAVNGVWPTGLVSASNIQYNAWTHIAIIRLNVVLYMYINGVLQSTYSPGANVSLNGNGPLNYIGKSGDSAATFYNGYIDDFRITKGIARYTANFTPPTQAFPNL